LNERLKLGQPADQKRWKRETMGIMNEEGDFGGEAYHIYRHLQRVGATKDKLYSSTVSSPNIRSQCVHAYR